MTHQPPAPNLHGELILVVDDDPAIRNLMSRIIKMLNGSPIVAASIAEAEQAAATNAFACALIDKNLGPDQNGLDFLRWIREHQPECAPVMVTAFGNIESAIEALRLGATDYLLKPFALDVIAHRLTLLCERRRMIRERDLLQSQLLQTDRLAALGTLAAGVVHEINNPLTYLLSNLDYLGEQLAAMRTRPVSDDDLAELTQVVGETREGATQMASVVNHIKAFARHEDAQRSRTNVQALLEGALKMSSVLIRNRAQLKRDFGPAPDVEALDFQIAQVFINLLVNASQAITEGAAQENVIGARLRTGANGEAVIEVSDTGSGMTPEVLARLFEPFFTTKPRGVGTGVGLTICRNIVEAHGGRIEVESTLGQGSVFRVILPGLPAAPRLPVDEAPSATPPAGRRGRVLVVDDDPSLVASLRRCLENDHDITTELDGRRALERIRAGERFDAILSDLSMPQVTGRQLYQALERECPHQAARMLFMTAGVLSPDTLDFAGVVADRLFEKPLVLSRLRESIRGMISAA